MIVVDTNVWSEATKIEPNPVVRAWAQRHQHQLWLTSVVLAELRAGAAMLPHGKRRAALEHQFDSLATDFEDRMLPFDAATSALYARVLETAKNAGKPIATADAMIAATALQHGMAVATRDLGDFAGAGVKLINPWDA
jgi:hypothetical protein